MEIEKKEAAAKSAVERPLPPVPEIVVDQSLEKIASSMKKTKNTSLVSRWFAEKKAVRFSTADVFEVDHAEDEVALNDDDSDADDDDDNVEGEPVPRGAKKPDDDLSIYSPKYRSPR